MNSPIKNIALGLVLIILVSSFSSCTRKKSEGKIILTLVAELNEEDFLSGENWRFYEKGRLVVYSPNEPEKNPLEITSDFYSACSPSISFNGKSMLFAAQKEQFDPWQIWEMDLSNYKSRKISSFTENCIDPAYLPGDRFVFSRSILLENYTPAFALFTGNIDGSSFQKITYQPHVDFATSVLDEGRILTHSREIYPNKKASNFRVMRPDGTKSELFYSSNMNGEIVGKAFEAPGDSIYFVERDSLGFTNIVFVNEARPLHSAVVLSSKLIGNFKSISPSMDNKIWATFKSTEGGNFGLYQFNPLYKELSESYFQSSDYHVVEAVEIFAKERPRNLPSAVVEQTETGLLMCQNINYSSGPLTTQATHVEILGMDKKLGTIPVEEDGSFYIKIAANTSFQFQLLDKEGNVIHGPSGWLYMRPNERRACVGCHADRELAPKNIVPMAVKKSPLRVPEEKNEVVRTFKKEGE